MQTSIAMATVIADMSMSLDGFIADRNDDVGPLFDWYRVGPVTTPSADERWSFHTSEASATELREFLPAVGALVCGVASSTTRMGGVADIPRDARSSSSPTTCRRVGRATTRPSPS